MRHEIQTWTLTGSELPVNGDIRTYGATWTSAGTGQFQRNEGSRVSLAQWGLNIPPTEAPLSLFVRSGKFIIRPAHAQKTVSNAVTGSRQVSVSGVPQPPGSVSFAVEEWPLPALETIPGEIVTGTFTVQTRGIGGDLPGSPAPAVCRYEFSTGGAAQLRAQKSSGAATAGTSNLGALRTAGTPSPMKQLAGQSTTPPSPQDTLGVPTVNPARAQTAATPGIMAKLPTHTISAVTPTGAPPANFTVTAPSPAVALVQWTPAVDPGASGCDGFGGCTCAGPSASYHLYRSEESAGAIELPIPPVQCERVAYRDEGVSPRFTYTYRLVANYQDGTWGEASATLRPPALVNPTGFRATVVPPDTVQLQWDATGGALRYRIDGSTLPITGKELTETSLTISPFRGPGSWQVVAIYPGNFADYGKPSIVRTIAKDIPSHSPVYLSKTAGPGSAAETAAHYAQFCNWTDDSPLPCGNLVGYLQSWGVTSQDISADAAGKLVQYNNVTDLGSPRETRCLVTQPAPVEDFSQKRKFFGRNVVICYSNTGSNVSFIVMNSEGARFGVFQIGMADSSGYGGGWSSASLIPTSQFDSEGPKFAPHACLACHGGRYDSTTKLVQGASLLPIDPSLVQVVGDPIAAQEKIRMINALVRQSYSSSAVAAYIDGLYGGFQGTHHKVDDSGAQAITDFAPSGWTTQKSLYLDFVKKDCAMCHLAASSNLNFLSAGNFLSNKALVHTAVCKAHSMPHAETAFLNFWTRQSGPASGPGWFATALGYPDCQ